MSYCFVLLLPTVSVSCSYHSAALAPIRGYPPAEGIFSRPLPHFGGDQCEMYTLHYVETLMAQSSTWQLAAEYLAWCPVHGADTLEAMLMRILVRTEPRVYSTDRHLCNA